VLTILAIGCSSSAPPPPRYTPGAPGQWGGTGARSTNEWHPPPTATSKPPPTLIDTALDTIDILVKPAPRRLR
jgi:hypothetical protein